MPTTQVSDDVATTARRLIRDIADYPKPGIVFKDITPLLADPVAFGRCVAALAEAPGAAEADLIAGVEARGFIVAAALARAVGAGMVPVRKAGKLPGATLSQGYDLEYGRAEIEVHAEDLAEGDRVAVIDDVLATGRENGVRSWSFEASRRGRVMNMGSRFVGRLFFAFALPFALLLVSLTGSG